jgi:hypothetical protein
MGSDLTAMKEDETARIKPERVHDKLRWLVGHMIQQTFLSATTRALQQKEAGFSKSEIFTGTDLAEHFAHMYLPDVASQNVVKGFIIDRIRFIEQVLGEERIRQDTFIDIGDPDGIFLMAFKKTRLSANISDAAVRNVRSKGLEVLQCDAEHLPFKACSFDHILYFEILEHLKNPIGALAELHRVAERSVFVSIPFVSRTNILQYRYNPDWPVFEHHVFEFDDEDFRNIITHAGFRVDRSLTIDVMRPETIRERMVFLLWDLVQMVRKDPQYKDNRKDLFAGCFRKFSIYSLVKEWSI